MTKNIDNKKEEVKAPVEEKGAICVTSVKTIDFPSLNWGINQGEVRELPVDAEAQKIILSNKNIKKVK